MTPDPLHIERLTTAHAGAYRALMLEAYAAHPDAFTSTPEERAGLALSWWETRLAAGDGAADRVFGAMDAGRIAGVAGLSFHRREKLRHKATLFGMYVRPAYRQQGLGRRLVEAVLDEARRHANLHHVLLTVSDTNAAAQQLYAACGFEPYGTEPRAIRVGDAFVGKVLMWCDLHATRKTIER
ncbi:MAG: GNAT family N-acetyltransferase [Rhodothermales bacterium]